MTPEEKYLEENASPSPDIWRKGMSDLHPLVEQRFQKLEEAVEGLKDYVMPFLERAHGEVAKIKEKFEELRLKLDHAATPEFTEEEAKTIATVPTPVAAPEVTPIVADVLTIPGNSESLPKES